MGADDQGLSSPHIVVVRFDRRETRHGVLERGIHVVRTLNRFGPTRLLTSSYDASVCALLVSTTASAEEIQKDLQDAGAGDGALDGGDRCWVFRIGPLGAFDISEALHTR
jgi:hypothetical protein